jgi:hypothetical protein
VRDLARVEGGLLILAGPVGDGPGSYQLYLWDGRDGVPGTGAHTSAINPGLRLIGDIPIPPSNGHETPAKAEGMALIEETSHHWKILVASDGPGCHATASESNRRNRLRHLRRREKGFPQIISSLARRIARIGNHQW